LLFETVRAKRQKNDLGVLLHLPSKSNSDCVFFNPLAYCLLSDYLSWPKGGSRHGFCMPIAAHGHPSMVAVHKPIYTPLRQYAYTDARELAAGVSGKPGFLMPRQGHPTTAALEFQIDSDGGRAEPRLFFARGMAGFDWANGSAPCSRQGDQLIPSRYLLEYRFGLLRHPAATLA